MTAIQILLIVKEGNEEAKAKANEILAWLEKHTIKGICLFSHTPQDIIIQEAMNSHAALIIGGDGTMLASARALCHKPIPLFGINYGKVGFLTEAQPADWEFWIEKLVNTLYIKHNISGISGSHTLLSEDLLIEETHLVFQYTVKRGTLCISQGYAVNDAVIARGAIARAIGLTIYIDGNHLSNLRCDGLILSTPLGATAYAISAHGPLALPGLDAQIITPICPFAGAFPPCVVAGSSHIKVVIADSGTPAILTLDGQETVELQTNDEIEVTTVKNKMKLYVSDKAWYVKRLVDRGFIHPGPGVHSLVEK